MVHDFSRFIIPLFATFENVSDLAMTQPNGFQLLERSKDYLPVSWLRALGSVTAAAAIYLLALAGMV